MSFFEKTSKQNAAVEKPEEPDDNLADRQPTIAEMETQLFEDLSAPYLNDTQPMEKASHVVENLNTLQPSPSAAVLLDAVNGQESTSVAADKSSFLEVKSVETINEQVSGAHSEYT